MTHIIVASLLLVSGVYYPVEVLPPALEALSVLSPAYYVLEGVRAAILENAAMSELWQFIWLTLVLALVMVPSGLWTFGQAELYAKRKGKLARNG